jgi:Fibronectin type III domain
MHSRMAQLGSAVVGFLLVTGCDEQLAPVDDLVANASGSKLPAPSATVATPILSDRVDVFWTDNSTNEGGFRVERSTNGGTIWVTAAVLAPNVAVLVDLGRTAEQRVCYRVFATAGKGNGAASAPSPVACTTPPAAPTALTAVSIGAHTVDLTWQDNSRVEDGYYLTRFTQENLSDERPIAELPADATSYHDAGLSSQMTYRYRVRARKDGGFGSHSNIVIATTLAGPPVAPSGVDAVAQGAGTVSVTWVDNSTEETGFRVERGPGTPDTWAAFATVAANTRAVTDANQPVERAVCYRVIAFNSGGDSEFSNVDCATTPAAPSGLTATAGGETSIDLAWVDNSQVEDGYEVERENIVVATLTANATTYHDAGLVPNTRYHYRVRARKADGFSMYSGLAAAVTTTVPPLAAGELRATPWSSSSVTLSWSDNSATEDGFRIERSFDRGASWDSAGTAGPDVLWFDDSGRQSEQELCYRVMAYNSGGDAGPSNIACTTPPAAPGNLAGGPTEDQSIELRWDDNSNVEDNYQIWLATPEDFYLVATLPANSTSARMPSYGINWDYAVAVGKDGGMSDFACCVSADPTPTSTASALLSAQARVRRFGLHPRTTRGGSGLHSPVPWASSSEKKP